jgi:hypothetical protein
MKRFNEQWIFIFAGIFTMGMKDTVIKVFAKKYGIDNSSLVEYVYK